MKPYVCIYLLLMANILAHTSQAKQQEKIAISLGKDCQAAGNLRAAHLRTYAFPFDWIASQDFNSIIKLIEQDFVNYLQPTFLTLSNGFVYNTYYQVTFHHDFPASTLVSSSVVDELDGSILYQDTVLPNYLDMLPEVIAKYDRRIKRFVETLNSNKQVFFFRAHITPEQAQAFTVMMHTKYPLLDYVLVALHDNQKYDYLWNIPQVREFYITKYLAPPNPNKWWDAEAWLNVFRTLLLI